MLQGFQKRFSTVFLFSLLLCASTAGAETDQKAIFGDLVPGLPAAFGDFNGDKKTDLFTIRTNENGGSSVEILLANETEPFLRQTNKLICSFKNHIITSVVPGDFDKDAMMDVLVTTQDRDSNITFVYVHKGAKDSVSCAVEKKPLLKMKSQPIAVDYNKDGILDLFGEDEIGARKFWVFKKILTVTPQPIPLESGAPAPAASFRQVHSNAFLDLNSDGHSDLYITTVLGYEIWYGGGKGNAYTKEISKDFDFPENTVIGQTTFLDFESTGVIHQLVPTCRKNPGGIGCTHSQIHVYQNGKKLKGTIPISFEDPNQQKWSFAYNEVTPNHYLNAITLRAGDSDLDGFPDLLVTLSPENNSSLTQTFLLRNIQLDSNYNFKRAFDICWTDFTSEGTNTILGVFSDLKQDGDLDIIFVKDDLKVIGRLNRDENADNSFFKVMVTSSKPREVSYPTNLPGPSVVMTLEEGPFETATSVQIPQSAHFALQQPYTIFGLNGSTDYIRVFLVKTGGEEGEFKFFIPNSHIVVFPYPLDDPEAWKVMLFLPRRLTMVWQGTGALLGTCLFVAAIVSALHWRDCRYDKPEKTWVRHYVSL